MTGISDALRIQVRRRAQGRCEYCGIHEVDTAKRHHVDHIRAIKHHGTDDESNLCLCCASCNRYKGTDLTSVDPETEQITQLYNPRKDQWKDHFQLNGASIDGLTPEGRTTAALLRFNSPERIEERERLMKLKRYP